MREDRRRYVASCVGLIGAWSLVPSLHAKAPTDELRCRLRFALSLTNSQSHALENQVLWLYMPVSETPTQKLEGLTVSMACERSSDRLGHSVVKLAFPRFAPWSSKIVTLAADVTMSRVPSDSSLADAGAWLKHERYIEVDDPRIKAVAAELRRLTARETAEAIYAWVRQYLHYAGYIADDLGALQALLQRRGDCTEYAYLAAALARANGLPARVLGGYVTDRSVAPRAEDYHNWAEVYLDGAWRLLDAQKENWLAPAEQYIAFRIYSDEYINPLGLAPRFKVDGELQVRW